MEITVSEEIISETSKCPKKFQCLSSEPDTNPDLCKIKLSDGKYVLFLQSEIHDNCPYCLTFGFGQVCTCPTRYAIFTTYRK